MQSQNKFGLLALAASLGVLCGDRAVELGARTFEAMGWEQAQASWGRAYAQEAPDDDDDAAADDDDAGGDGGAEDPGNDGVQDDAGDDDAGADAPGADAPGADDAGADDAAAGDDGAAAGAGDDNDGGDDGAAAGVGGDDDGAGGGGGAAAGAGDDDDGGDDGAAAGAGDDDDGAGGDDGAAAGGGDDDDGAGGGGPTAGAGDDDDGPGGDDDDGPGDDGGETAGAGGESGADGDNDRAAPGGGAVGSPSRDRRASAGDEAPGGAGARRIDGGSARIRDGDDDARAPSSLPDGVDLDDEGRWIKAGEVLAIEADPTSLEFARGLGFQVIERHRLTTLGLSVVELRVPAGRKTREALAALRQGAPDTAFDFNHVYLTSQKPPPRGAAAARKPSGARAVAAPKAPVASGKAIGIVDTGVDAAHPALRGVRIQQANFAGKDAPVAHGTAVASVLVNGGSGHRLLAASVVERSNGNANEVAAADALVRALDWLAQSGAPVVNISLAGPPNSLLEDAVRRAQKRGMIIVAAVGNDGPAAPPLYPAAYEGVVGVTAVDSRGSVYRRAGRGSHVDVAAPGVGVTVAGPAGKLVEASGTSYAAPAVAAALAAQYEAPDPQAAQGTVQRVLSRAADAGELGKDPVYGAGVLRMGGASQ